MDNQERKQNGFYIAVAVLLFIAIGVMSIIVFVSIYIMAIGPELAETTAQESGGTVEDSSSVLVGSMAFLLVYALISIGFNIFLAIFFLKHSRMTNLEADRSYNACLTWTIISFFTSGLLVGGLALGGLLSIQKKQKDNLANVQSVQPAAPIEQNSSTQQLDRLQSELLKLSNMKNSGVITEEEYNEMRKKVIKDFSAK